MALNMNKLIQIIIIPLGLCACSLGWTLPQDPLRSKESVTPCESLLDHSIDNYMIWGEVINLSSHEIKDFMQILLKSRAQREAFDRHISSAIFKYIVQGGEPSDLYSDEQFLSEVRLAYDVAMSIVEK